jgi:hypothetical protein
MAGMRKALLFVVAAGLCTRHSSGQEYRLLRVESARIGQDHRVYLRWTGQPERAQPPGEEQTDTENLKIAPDRSAVAWLVGRTDLSDANYPEAFELRVAWNGRPAHSIFPGRVISKWQFENGGRRVALCESAGHGDQAPYAMLYDARAGELLATWSPDSKTAPPAWAAPFHAQWDSDDR